MPKRTSNNIEEKREPPKRNEGRSSEINLEEILSLAREVDAEAQAEPEEKPKRGRKKKDAKAPPAELAPEPVLLVADPEFEAMLNWGVGSAVDFAKLKLDWTEPGIHWRLKVSVMLSRLIQRIQPMSESWVTDLITIGGYTALWVVPNVSAGGRTSPASDRDNGNRKDLQNEGAS